MNDCQFLKKDSIEWRKLEYRKQKYSEDYGKKNFYYDREYKSVLFHDIRNLQLNFSVLHKFMKTFTSKTGAGSIMA
jgi:hypothetical protein